MKGSYDQLAEIIDRVKTEHSAGAGESTDKKSWQPTTEIKETPV
jgi:hypothetical protein